MLHFSEKSPSSYAFVSEIIHSRLLIVWEAVTGSMPPALFRDYLDYLDVNKSLTLKKSNSACPELPFSAWIMLF